MEKSGSLLLAYSSIITRASRWRDSELAGDSVIPPGRGSIKRQISGEMFSYHVHPVKGLTDRNVKSRERGLMALVNLFEYLVTGLAARLFAGRTLHPPA
jgi:hypothetical protein